MPFDIQLDQEGVQLAKEIRCFSCGTMMKPVGPGSYKCPSCRVIFNDEDER